MGKMIPVKYDGTKWIKADTTQEWYDYTKMEWANAIIPIDNSITYNNGDEIPESNVKSYLE